MLEDDRPEDSTLEDLLMLHAADDRSFGIWEDEETQR